MFLGISVAVVQESQSQSRKRAAFNADITYLTANSLGFTFLSDTSAVEKEEDLVCCCACVVLMRDAKQIQSDAHLCFSAGVSCKWSMYRFSA